MDKNTKRFIDLGWRILESKLTYYYPNLCSPTNLKKCTISDDIYDALEAEYKELGAKLNLPLSACSQVGFPINSPSGKLIVSKLMKD